MGQARPTNIAGIAVKPAKLGDGRSDGNAKIKNLCIIHDIEGSAASALSTFAADQKDGGSTQLIADPNNNVFWQLLDMNLVAYGCGNYEMNQRAIQVELPGFAGRQFDPAVLDYAARFMAYCNLEWGIPLVKVSRQQIVDNPNIAGVCGHEDAPNPDNPSQGGGRDSHTDPGPTFPWDIVITKARMYAGSPPLRPESGASAIAHGLGKPGESSADARHIWPTGYSVGGSFWRYWSTVGGVDDSADYAAAVAIFGYPVSRPIADTGAEGHPVVQHFERARFELQADGKTVTLGRLGAEAWEYRKQFFPRIASDREDD